MRLLIATRTPRRFESWLELLDREGYEAHAALPERRALAQAFGGEAPDAVLIDLVDGASECAAVRNTLAQIYYAGNVPLIGVVRSESLGALETEGLDDVLDEGATTEEVLFRARRAALRRAGQPATIQLGELSVRPAEGLVYIGSRRVPLRHREFELLRFLIGRPNRVFRREELAREVWGPRFRGTLRTVDTHVCRLRTRLGQFGEQHLQTVRGVGYRLANPSPRY